MRHMPGCHRGAKDVQEFDGADSAHAAADGSAPQAWVWSQYKGVLPGVENRGAAAAKESAPPVGSQGQTKVEFPQTVSDRQSAPQTEALISTDRARHPIIVAIGFTAAIMILVVLAWLFSPGPAP